MIATFGRSRPWARFAAELALLAAAATSMALGTSSARPGQKFETGNPKVGNRLPKLGHPKRPERALGPSGVTLALIADPALSYSTYLGGSAFEMATGVAVDSKGNVYVTGTTNSPDFPTVNAAQAVLGGGTCGSGLDTYLCFDAFVSKFDPTGEKLIYATYFGGSGEDYATGIAIDSEGNAYVTGYTNSADLPTVNAFQAQQGGGSCGAAPSTTPCFDAFVAKLDATGAQFVYSTYLGGSGDDYAQGIAVDAAGNVVVTGFTSSTDFPTSHALLPGFGGGALDAFVVKLDASGSRLAFSTYLGGSGDDFGTGLGVDGTGSVYLTGTTNSPDLPVAGGLERAYAGGACGALSSTYPCFDGYVAKFSADGARFEYLTYLGGTGGDYAYGIAVDAAGSAIVSGMTTSHDFPVTLQAFQTTGGGNNTDAFVAKLDPAGSSLVYSTYLGGIGAESASGVAVDAEGRALVTGYTYGSGFPLVNPIQSASGGFHDAFFAILNEGGTALEFSTYFGGTGNERASAAALGPYGNLYAVGETFSTDLATTKQAFQAAYAGGSFDTFMMRIATGDFPVLHLSATALDFGTQPIATTSGPQVLRLTNLGGSQLAISALGTTGDFAQSHDCGAALEVGESCEVSITFTPSARGLRTGSLSIVDDDSAGGHSVPLSGTGTASEITLSQDSLVFGHQLLGTVSPPQTLTLTNTGKASLELSGISVSGDFTETHDCGENIGVGASCSIHLTFAPASSGDRSGTLRVTNTLPEETRTAALSGTGTNFTLASTPGQSTVTAGQSATFTLTANPDAGFHGTIALACTGAPAGAQCSVSPQSLAVDGLNPSTATVTVSTKARAMAAPQIPRQFPPLSPLITPVLWLLVIAMIAAQNRRVRELLCAPRTRLARAWVTLTLLTVFWSACGGGTRPPAPQSGTPPGTYTLTLTGSTDGVSRVTVVGLTVK